MQSERYQTFKYCLIRVNQYKKKRKMEWEVYLTQIGNSDKCRWEHKISQNISYHIMFVPLSNSHFFFKD